MTTYSTEINRCTVQSYEETDSIFPLSVCCLQIQQASIRERIIFKIKKSSAPSYETCVGISIIKAYPGQAWRQWRHSVSSASPQTSAPFRLAQVSAHKLGIFTTDDKKICHCWPYGLNPSPSILLLWVRRYSLPSQTQAGAPANLSCRSSDKTYGTVLCQLIQLCIS